MGDEPQRYPWHAVLMVEGTRLADERVVQSGALYWPHLPVPVVEVFGGRAIGQVEKVWRVGDTVYASGWADRDLAVGAAVHVRSESHQFEDEGFGSVRLVRGELREVATTSLPACPLARFYVGTDDAPETFRVFGRGAAIEFGGERYLPESAAKQFARFVLVITLVVAAFAFASGCAIGHLL